MLARWIFDDSGADYHDLKALARFLLHATPRRATCLGIYGNLRTTSTTFSSCAGRLASLGESRHTAFFLDVCERGITNIERSNQTRCLNTPVSYLLLNFKTTAPLSSEA